MTKFEFHSVVDVIKKLDFGENAVVIGGQALIFVSHLREPVGAQVARDSR